MDIRNTLSEFYEEYGSGEDVASDEDGKRNLVRFFLALVVHPLPFLKGQDKKFRSSNFARPLGGEAILQCGLALYLHIWLASI